MRHKFEIPEDSSQPASGFVQFINREDAAKAIKSMSCIAFILFMHELPDNFV